MRTVDLVDEYPSFINLIEKDTEIYKKFVEYLTINVSEFFRNESYWTILKDKIIPDLLKNKQKIKIWSAGCSTGEEPYSLAILMKEYFDSKSDIILATDIDQEVLDRSSKGLYGAKAIESVGNDFKRDLAKYFIKEENSYRAQNDIRKLITFKKHDLLKDNFDSNFDLILCRNVVIYFTEEAKTKLYEKFAKSLNLGGVLFVGNTEQIFQTKELGLKTVSTFFYKK